MLTTLDKQCKHNLLPDLRRAMCAVHPPLSHEVLMLYCMCKNVRIFFPGADADISQSTSNLPSLTGSDSSPDSTPGLPRKLDLREGNNADQVS